MLDEIKFWLDFGIDGFRFDVINFLFHDKNLRNNPYKDPSEIRPLDLIKIMLMDLTYIYSIIPVLKLNPL